MTTENPPVNPERQRFHDACASVLGHHFPATDRELAFAALAVMCARTPADAPLDQALRSFVVAIAPLVGRASPAELVDLVKPESLRPIKHKCLMDALGHGPAMVILDAMYPGVDVPDWLSKQRDLRLRIGLDLKPEIPDLVIDDAGWRATLIFRGVPHKCVIPWDAVWAIGSEVTQQGMGWPQCAPEGFDPNGPPSPVPDAPKAPRAPRKFGVIAGGTDAPTPAIGALEEAIASAEIAADESFFDEDDTDVETITKTVPELGPPTRHNGKPIGLCAMSGCEQCNREIDAAEPAGAFAYSPGMDYDDQPPPKGAA